MLIIPLKFNVTNESMAKSSLVILPALPEFLRLSKKKPIIPIDGVL
jgi:hypothetical protein